MISQNKIPYYKHDIGQDEIDAVVRVLKSDWINTGPETTLFEKELAEYTGATRVVALNSATAALFLALKVFGVGPGDEVITTALTYAATANAILHTGAKPVFVDIGDDYNIDSEAVASAMSPSVKAVIAVDLGGLPCDYKKLTNVLSTYNGFTAGNDYQSSLGRPLLLSDAAHSIGASYDGHMSGKLADVTAFSFHAVKNITTSDGGALLINSDIPFDGDDFENNVRLYSLHGQSKSALAKMNSGAWSYDIIVPGYKFNMTDINAALGRVQLKRLPSFLERRAAITQLYDSLFKDDSLFILRNEKSDEYKSSNHLYILRLRDKKEKDRNLIIEKLSESGIVANVHYKPLPYLSCYNSLGYTMDGLLSVDEYYQNEITLPLYTQMSNDDVERVAKNLKDLLV